MIKPSTLIAVFMLGFLPMCAMNPEKLAKITHAKAVLSDFDNTVTEYLRLLEVPGATIGIVVDGEVVFSKAYGVRNIDKGLKTTTRTLFPIGSATKAFTSALLGILTEEGILQFDDPISQHIPFFRLQDPFTTYEITIRDYLTHVSGYAKNDALWYNLNLSREELVRKLRYLEPSYSFRSKFHYQNIGYTIAAYAAELATAKSYEELLQEKIFAPLGLESTTLCSQEFKDSEDHATGYRFHQKKMQPSHLINLDTVAPAGGIYSNLEDMLLWTKALLQQDSNLLEKRTWQEIFTPQVSSNVICNVGYDIEEYVPMEAYGLGWFLVTYRGHFMAFHGGNVEGFSSNTLLLPRDDIGIVVLTNKNYSALPYIVATVVCDKLLDLPEKNWVNKYSDFFQTYTKDNSLPQITPIENTKSAKTTPTHPLKEYQGAYIHPAFGKIDLYLKGNSLTAILNQIPMNLYHLHYNVFEVGEECPHSFLVGLKFSFHENIYGDINSVEVPLDPLNRNLFFLKQKDLSLNDISYLERFVGTYSYYGFTFPIERKENSLIVKAMGQPEFKLVPEKFGIFKVLNYEGHLVQFLLDDLNEVTAVQLLQPNNSSYTASRQKN